MIKVALVTSWGDRCGTSSYAANLWAYARDQDVSITIKPTTLMDMLQRPEQFDIIHVNESGFVMQGTVGALALLRCKAATSKKFLLTLHDSNPVDNRNEFTQAFDRVVVHDRDTQDGFTYVPQGAPVFVPKNALLMNPSHIGTNGLPQERKNLENLAIACQRLGLGIMAYIPESPHADAQKVASRLHEINRRAMVYTEWQTDANIIQALMGCGATCYPYTQWGHGPSAAALYGVAAGRPVIVSRTREFHHMSQFENEVYFIESTHPTADDIQRGLEDYLSGPPYRYPTELFEHHRWDKVGQQYIKIYKELMA